MIMDAATSDSILERRAATETKQSFNELIADKVWIDAKVHPPEPGLIVKRWKTSTGWAHWAGYFNGDVKSASCDFWLSLPE